MQRLAISLEPPPSGGLARQATLLLLLSAALAGFFLLLEYVVSLVSTGPRDILAVNPADERRFGIPNGVDLLEFLVLPVSMLLASAALAISLGWPLRRTSFRPSWSLAFGVLAAAALVAAGAYLAFSGLLGSAVSYDEHLVQRTYLESGSLVLLATFFLSLTIAGILNWRLLAVSLVLWLAAAGVFGFLDTKPIDGLLLFPRTQFLEVPAQFAAAVTGLRQTEGTSSGQPAGPAATAASTLSDTSLWSEVTALQLLPPGDAPMFQVAGAAHTRYLRTSTGDTYRDGTWGQLDLAAVALDKNTSVPDALGRLADQLHLPAATPLHEFVDRIVVTPIEGGAAFAAGVLPVARNLQRVDTPATYFPFSETLAVDSGLSGYEVESTLPLFALKQKIGASSVADQAYLQLPDGLPPRVHELAGQVAGAASPYLNARLLQVHLQEEYAFGAAATDEEVQPPAGQDPIDWFLFDRRVGASGNFSSAFVVLARAAGIPARAVSGWVVARQEDTQTVHRSQTHQWAEIALDGLGWVTVDPLPRDAFSDTGVNHAWEAALDEIAVSAVPEVREAVAALWGDFDNPESLLLLFQTIDNAQDPDARHAAQTALSTLALDHLIEVLLDHGDPLIRAATAYGLGVLADPGALDALIEALGADEDARVRAAAADALAILGKDSAEEPLLRALETDEDARVREAAARALGALKTEWTAGRMLPALSSDPAPEVRAEVALALGEIRNNVALRPLLDARSDDASPEVRSAAAEALAEWDFDALLLILETAVDPLQRTAAVELMRERKYSHARALNALLRALATDEYAQVRVEAAYALGEAGDSIALRPLLDARSDDGSAAVRNAAAEALAAWGLPALLTTLEGAADPAQRAAAAQLMGERQYTGAIPALTRALADPAEEVRDAALEALERLGVDINGLEGNGTGAGGPEGSGGTGDQGSGGTGAGGGIGTDDGAGVSLSWQDIVSLAREDEATRDAALEALEGQGAGVTRLENGGALVTQADDVFFTFGTTTSQATELPHIPVFEISGVVHSGYLRLVVGDVYEDGGWRQLDPVAIPYSAGGDVAGEVLRHYSTGGGDFSAVGSDRQQSPSLFGFRNDLLRTSSDRVRAVPTARLGELPPGIMPTSFDLQQTDLDGTFYPFSATFSSESSATSYSWTSNVPYFSEAQYTAATVVTDATYTQLPLDMPARIRELALQITGPHDSPYAKARALERHLKTRYTYGFADSASAGPPAGRDPVEWFLFDTRRGTCGQFSSAFVVLARSVGIPARVVGGWVVSSAATGQTVYTDQAHQWAEVALEGIGWVGFEPTAAGGAPSRVPGGGSGGSGSSDGPTVSGPAETVTNITRWPSEIRRQTPFVVGGTVLTAGGENVNGMTVEIYINETKEHGGTKIGTTTSRFGRFEAEVQLPADMELGGYQLLARAVGNDLFYESWSDPDIKVFSGNRIELAGPAEVTLNARAVFRGRILEDSGRGVAGRELGVTFDGNAAPPVTTDASGGFTFSESFSRLGQHWVEVEIRGEEFLLDNAARLDFQVVLPTEIEVYAPGSVVIGEEFLVTGELRGADGAALGGKRVGVRVGRSAERSVTTDREGRFEVAGAASTAGEFTVSAGFRGEGSVLASAGTTRVEALHAVELTLEGPLRLKRGDGATFRGRVASDTFSPTGQVELSVEGAGGEQRIAVNVGEDGTFVYEHPSFDSTGPHTLMARFAGGALAQPASTEFAFEVLQPTVLALDGPAVVRDGDGFRLTGTLHETGGSPVPNAEVQVVGGEPLSLTTDADGTFAWDAHAVFDAGSAHDPYESTLDVEVVFDGTDLLAPTRATLDVPVGTARIVVEPPGPVVRGREAVLRGTVLLGTYPVPGAALAAGPGVAFETNDVGAFAHPYPVSADAPLGTTEVAITAPGLDADVTTPLVVKSAANLVVTPVSRVRPGRATLLQAALVDDTGAGIPHATLRSSQGVDAVTDEFGIASIELAAPGSEDLEGALVVFAYAGDSLHAPLTMSYFWEGAITPAGFNWLLWVGAPGLVALAIAAAYTGRRFKLKPLPAPGRSRGAPVEPVPEAPGTTGGDEPDGDAGPAPRPVHLRIEFRKAAPDLADVWGTGEEVSVTVRMTDEEDHAIAGAIVAVSVAGDGVTELAIVGGDGTYTFSLSISEPGEYPVSVEFGGDDAYLPSSESRGLRIVEFREEIVRLYNAFLDWAKERADDMTEQSTPREVEVVLVSRGLPVPQKALDELISRFEEADYSEHPIARRHYEAMYRAWSAVVGDQR